MLAPRLLPLLLLVVVYPLSPRGLPGAQAATTTVTTCASLSLAISSGATDILIPARTTIDLLTCKPVGLPAITGPVKIRGGGTPLPVLTGRNKTRILTVAPGTLPKFNVSVSNLVLANGMADYKNGVNGGCFFTDYYSGASAVFSNVTFANCTAYNGGAIFVDRAGVTVQTCTFSKNLAMSVGGGNAQGGAICKTGADTPVSISSTTFTGNAAYAFDPAGTQNWGSAYGGSVYSEGDSFVWDSSFNLSSALASSGSAVGGAVYASTRTVTVRNSAFTLNSARSITSGVGYTVLGGAIHTANIIVSSSVFLSNTLLCSQGSYAFGGALHVENGFVGAVNCSFRSNTATMLKSDGDAVGGAVRITTQWVNSPSSSYFTLCSFTGNAVSGAQGYGGAISSTYTVKLDSCTFVNNSAVATVAAARSAYAAGSAAGGAVMTGPTSQGSSTNGDVYAANTVFQGNYAAGTAYGTSAGVSGGAIQCSGFTAYLQSCTFAQNYVKSAATSDGVTGGALCATAAYISSTSFTNSSASSTANYAFGGAIYAWAPFSCTDCVFSGNSAAAGGTSGKAAEGGAVCLDNWYATSLNNFTRNTFNSNTVRGQSAYGGAVFNSYSSRLTNCTFSANSATSTAGNTFNSNYGHAQGGAYYLDPQSSLGDLTTQTQGCSFVANAVDGTNSVGGGAVKTRYPWYDTASVYSSNKANLRFTSCSSGCPPSASGGAIWMPSGSVSLARCSFTSNTVSSVPSDAAGGALDVDASDAVVTITDSTFTGNVANASCTRGCAYQNGGGGAVWCGGQLSVQSSAFTANIAVSKGISNFATGGAIATSPGWSDYSNITTSTFLSNAAVSVNSGEANGGALSLTVRDSSQANWVTACSFTNNTAMGLKAGGGAVSASAGPIELASSSFTNNSALSSGSQAFGGALDSHLSSDWVTLDSCSFSYNLASAVASGAMGGAVYFGNSGNTISGSLFAFSTSFSGNRAVSDNALGGALLIGLGVYNGLAGGITGCSFDGQAAVGDGATGGAVAIIAGASVQFSKGNRFGKTAKNVQQATAQGAVQVNDLDAAGSPVRFCPYVTVYTDADSNFQPLLDCSQCNCDSLLPCDSTAVCRMSDSSGPLCFCPAGTRGNGFNCGPIMVCS